MEEETKKFLVENYALNKENNEMLKKLVVFQKWNQIYKIVYWCLIIGITLGAFYFVQPFLDSLLGVYGINSSDIEKILK